MRRNKMVTSNNAPRARKRWTTAVRTVNTMIPMRKNLVGLPYLVDAHKAPFRRRSKGRGRAERDNEVCLLRTCGRLRCFGATQGGGAIRYSKSSRRLHT